MSNFFKKLFRKAEDDTTVPEANVGSAAEPAAGKLPPAGEPVVFHGVALPEGKHLFRKYSRTPRAWAAFVPQQEIGALWTALAERFPETGLWPVQLGGLDARLDVPDQSWQPWQLSAPQLPEQGYDAITFFTKENPPETFVDDDEAQLPAWFAGPFAFAEGSEGDPVWVNPRYLALPPYRHPELALPDAPDGTWLLLVPVDRPADTFGYLNWNPPNAHFGGKELTAVLRSWEDRFGAAPVTLGSASFELSVKRPPTTLRDAQLLAREQIIVDSDITEWDSYAELPEGLLGEDNWHFWWD